MNLHEYPKASPQAEAQLCAAVQEQAHLARKLEVLKADVGSAKSDIQDLELHLADAAIAVENASNIAIGNSIRREMLSRRLKALGLNEKSTLVHH